MLLVRFLMVSIFDYLYFNHCAISVLDLEVNS